MNSKPDGSIQVRAYKFAGRVVVRKLSPMAAPLLGKNSIVGTFCEASLT